MDEKDHKFSFETLETWQLARKLSLEIYLLTSKFPDSEKYGLVSQIRRAVVSVCANLAEGSGRYTPKDQASYSTTAYSGLMELLSHLILSHDLEFLPENELSTIKDKIQIISIKLSNLRKSQLDRAQKEKSSKK